MYCNDRLSIGKSLIKILFAFNNMKLMKILELDLKKKKLWVLEVIYFFFSLFRGGFSENWKNVKVDAPM